MYFGLMLELRIPEKNSISCDILKLDDSRDDNYLDFKVNVFICHHFILKVIF